MPVDSLSPGQTPLLSVTNAISGCVNTSRITRTLLRATMRCAAGCWLACSTNLLHAEEATALNSQKVVAAETAPQQRPNFVVLLVDDLGYMDISPNNPETFYETPHLEQFAQQGMRFTQGYAANPVCSPTRYSLMTGKYPSRVDATNWFSGVRNGKFRPAPLNDSMSLEEVTLAEALLPAGYQTAFLGKWHLGKPEELWPEHQGFGINIGGHHRGSPGGGYFSPYENPRLSDGPVGEHLTARLTDEAIRLIQQFDERPFLMYLSYYTVHTPLQAPEPLIEKYRRKAARLIPQEEFADEEQVWPNGKPRQVRVVQNHPTYAAMVETMDTSVGRILQTLKQRGLDNNTVVVFTSDNGGLSTAEGSPTSNLPLRGGKGWTYEGGIREPFLFRWTGQIPAGSVCDVPISSIDLFPTLCHLAGVIPEELPAIDGVNLTPLLMNKGHIPERSLFWHYPHYSNQGGFPSGAIRSDNWKLIERYETGACQLYDLASDVGEHNDVSENHPEKVTLLRERLHHWYQSVDAKFLQPLPNGPPPWHPEFVKHKNSSMPLKE